MWQGGPSPLCPRMSGSRKAAQAVLRVPSSRPTSSGRPVKVAVVWLVEGPVSMSSGPGSTLGLPTPKGRREPGRWLHALCPPPSTVLEELGPGTRQSTPEREGAWGTPAAGVGRDETIGATPRRTEAASRAWQRAPQPPRRWPRAMGAESGPGP